MLAFVTSAIIAVGLQGGGTPQPPINLPAIPGSFFGGESGAGEICSSGSALRVITGAAAKGYDYVGYQNYTYIWSITTAGSTTLSGPIKWDNIYWWLVCEDSDPFSVGMHYYPTLTSSRPTNLTPQIVNGRHCGESQPD